MLVKGMASKCFPACDVLSRYSRLTPMTGWYDPEFAAHICKRHCQEDSLTLASDSAIVRTHRAGKGRSGVKKSKWAVCGEAMKNDGLWAFVGVIMSGQQAVSRAAISALNL
jgi:hypothetical protein